MVSMKRQFKFLEAKIRFNVPHLVGKEFSYLKKAFESGWLAGDGAFTRECNKWLEKKLGCKKALITPSATAALEMIGILSKVATGSEVIMPSFTFVSTANAFVLRGATPVFADIRKDTLNIDESLIEKAITKKTRAVMVVHYAGVSCEMDTIRKIAKRHKLLLFEDAAQGILAKYKGRYLGTLGSLSALSFHETKNVISGEGGAILINDKRFIERAEIIREKGTNRSKFLRGEIDKYSWVDLGSSYLPSEIVAAFLFAQLEKAEEITKKRLKIWETYHERLKSLEEKSFLRRPVVPSYCEHNAHIYYILTDTPEIQEKLIKFLKRRGILATTHYVPLHSSPGGKKYGKRVGKMVVTNKVANTLIRLPLFYDLRRTDQDFVVDSIYNFFKK